MSQIATTIEQSKRLLSAGLCPNSADMSWHKYRTSKWDLWVGYYNRHIPDLQTIPAWSLAGLCELAKDKKTTALMPSLNPQFDSVNEYIEGLVELLELPDCEILPYLHER